MLTEDIVSPMGIVLQFMVQGNHHIGTPAFNASPGVEASLSGYPSDPYAAPFDPFIQQEVKNYYLSNPLSLSDLFSGQDDAGEFRVLHSAPPLEGATKHVAVGDPLTVLKGLSIFLGNDFSVFSNPYFPSYSKHEHNVYHPNYKGKVLTTSGYRFISDDPLINQESWPYTGWFGINTDVQGKVTNMMLGGFDTWHYDRNYNYHPAWLQANLDDYIGTGTDTVIESARYDPATGIFSYTAHFNKSAWGWEYDATFDFDVSFTYSLGPKWTPSNNGWYAVHQRFFGSTNYTCTTRNSRKRDISWGDPGPWVSWGNVPNGTVSGTRHQFWSLFAYGPAMTESQGFQNLRKVNVRTYDILGGTDSILEALEYDLGDELWRDIRAANAISGADALTTAHTALMTNNLENLKALGELAQFFEPLKSVSLLYTNLRRGNVAGAIKAFLDLLSDSYLLWKYGIVTGYSDAKEVASNIKQLRRELESGAFFKPTTGNGKHIVSLTYRNHPITVIARTKIRLQYTDSTLAAALLTAKAFGLLPTLANGWDMLPWSFVIDWFTNIGDKLSVIDSHLMTVLAIVHGSTSTLEVVRDIPTDLLSDYGCIPKLDPRLVLFSRVVERDIPRMYPTKLDLLPPSGGDVKVGAALTWQQISK